MWETAKTRVMLNKPYSVSDVMWCMICEMVLLHNGHVGACLHWHKYYDNRNNNFHYFKAYGKTSI